MTIGYSDMDRISGTVLALEPRRFEIDTAPGRWLLLDAGAIRVGLGDEVVVIVRNDGTVMRLVDRTTGADYQRVGTIRHGVGFLAVNVVLVCLGILSFALIGVLSASKWNAFPWILATTVGSSLLLLAGSRFDAMQERRSQREFDRVFGLVSG